VTLDTSAILAIVFREPERDELLGKLGAAPVVGVGAPTLAETAIVLAARLGEAGPRRLARILERAGSVVISFESPHWELAAEAWLRFGKGRHPAALDFGDCLAYRAAEPRSRPRVPQ
jgi:ribonuclease VapC